MTSRIIYDDEFSQTERAPMTNAERQKLWRQRHPDLHRRRNAAYMRRYRQRIKAAKGNREAETPDDGF